MDDFEYSVQISELDWDSFFQVCEECNMLPPSLAGLDDSGMSDIDDRGAQRAGFAFRSKVSDSELKIDGPPVCDGSPVDFYLSKYGLNSPEQVLSGSEDDFHMEAVNVFFERMKKISAIKDHTYKGRESVKTEYAKKTTVSANTLSSNDSHLVKKYYHNNCLCKDDTSDDLEEERQTDLFITEDDWPLEKGKKGGKENMNFDEQCKENISKLVSEESPCNVIIKDDQEKEATSNVHDTKESMTVTKGQASTVTPRKKRRKKKRTSTELMESDYEYEAQFKSKQTECCEDTYGRIQDTSLSGHCCTENVSEAHTTPHSASIFPKMSSALTNLNEIPRSLEDKGDSPLIKYLILPKIHDENQNKTKVPYSKKETDLLNISTLTGETATAQQFTVAVKLKSPEPRVYDDESFQREAATSITLCENDIRNHLQLNNYLPMETESSPQLFPVAPGDAQTAVALNENRHHGSMENLIMCDERLNERIKLPVSDYFDQSNVPFPGLAGKTEFSEFYSDVNKKKIQSCVTYQDICSEQGLSGLMTQSDSREICPQTQAFNFNCTIAVGSKKTTQNKLTLDINKPMIKNATLNTSRDFKQSGPDMTDSMKDINAKDIQMQYFMKNVEIQATIMKANDADNRSTDVEDINIKIDEFMFPKVEDVNMKSAEIISMGVKDNDIKATEILSTGFEVIDGKTLSTSAEDINIKAAEIVSSDVEDNIILTTGIKSINVNVTQILSTDVEDINTKSVDILSNDVEYINIKYAKNLSADVGDINIKTTEVLTTDIEDNHLNDAENLSTGVKDINLNDNETLFTSEEHININNADILSTGVKNMIVKFTETLSNAVGDINVNATEMLSTGVEDININPATVLSAGLADINIKAIDLCTAGVKDWCYVNDAEILSTGVEDMNIKDTEIISTGIENINIKAMEMLSTGFEVINAKSDKTLSTSVEDIFMKAAEIPSTVVEYTKIDDAKILEDINIKSTKVLTTGVEDINVNDTEIMSTGVEDIVIDAEVMSTGVKDIVNEAEMLSTVVEDIKVNNTKTLSAPVNDAEILPAAVKDIIVNDAKGFSTIVEDIDVKNAKIPSTGVDNNLNATKMLSTGVEDMHVKDAKLYVEDIGVKANQILSTGVEDIDVNMAEVLSTDVESINIKDAEILSTDVEEIDTKGVEILHPVYAMSSFWNEMEKLTINDILQLRLVGQSHHPSVLLRQDEGIIQEVTDTADSGYFAHLDESKPDRSSGDMSFISDFDEDLTQFLTQDSNKSHEALQESQNSSAIMWECDPDLSGNEIPVENDMYTETLVSAVNSDHAHQSLRKMCKNISVQNLQRLEEQPFTKILKSSSLHSIHSVNSIQSEVEDEYVDPFDRAEASSPVCISDEEEESSSPGISFSEILAYLFGAEEPKSNVLVGDTMDASFHNKTGISVPEMYDDFFSGFETENFFFTFAEDNSSSKDEMVPIFSCSRSSSRNLQFPEVYDYFFPDDSPVQSDEDEEPDQTVIRVITRYDHLANKDNVAIATSDTLEYFLSDSSENFLNKNPFSFRRIRRTGFTAPPQLSNSMALTNAQKTGKLHCRGIHPINVLGYDNSPFPDPLLLSLENRIFRQLTAQQKLCRTIQPAVTDPRVDAPLMPIKQADMCLVCIAFASWVLKSINPQGADTWKAVLLANISALSAIRYLRRFKRDEAAKIAPLRQIEPT